jgi:hypothetical protein
LPGTIRTAWPQPNWEVAEETGLTVTVLGAYLGHFDYLSSSGKKSRLFNFIATWSSSSWWWTPCDVQCSHAPARSRLGLRTRSADRGGPR